MSRHEDARMSVMLLLTHGRYSIVYAIVQVITWGLFWRSTLYVYIEQFALEYYS